MGTKHNNKTQLERAREIHGTQYDYKLTNFGKMHDVVLIECPTHGPFKRTMSDHIYKKVGCPKCGFSRIGNNTRFNTETFIEKSRELFGNMYDYSQVVYKNMHSKVIVSCPVHGAWSILPTQHIYQSTGCPQCSSKESKPEMRITEWLERHKIKFEKQYRFPDCKHIYQLMFDFFIPSQHLLIEYDGQHHFEPAGYIPEPLRYKAFETIKLCDNIKTEFASIKGIKLLRIPYTDEHKIEQILSDNVDTNPKI